MGRLVSPESAEFDKDQRSHLYEGRQEEACFAWMSMRT